MSRSCRSKHSMCVCVCGRNGYVLETPVLWSDLTTLASWKQMQNSRISGKKINKHEMNKYYKESKIKTRMEMSKSERRSAEHFRAEYTKRMDMKDPPAWSHSTRSNNAIRTFINELKWFCGLLSGIYYIYGKISFKYTPTNNER